MRVWQHLQNGDHLRRRAEGLIEAARGTKSVSAASTAEEAHKLELLDDLQHSPALVDMSGSDND